MALFDILINIAANTASFQSEMKRVTSTLEDVGEVLKSGLEFTGITVGLNELRESFINAAESGEQLQQLSERMGESVRSLSQLQYAAQAVNVPFQTLVSAIDILQRNLIQATDGTGRAKQALADLGIDAAKLAALPLDQQLDVLANKIASLPSPTQQTAAAMRVFGSAGADLLPILRDGAAGIEAFRERADAMGITLGADTTSNLAKANSALTDLKATSHAFWMELAGDVAPAVAAAEKWATQMVASARQLVLGYASPQEELAALTARATALQTAINALNTADAQGGFLGKANKFLDAGALKTDTDALAAVQAQIAKVQAQIVTPAATPAPNADNKFGPLPTDIDFQVKAIKTLTDYMQQYYDTQDKNSQTDVEQTVAAWNAKELAARQYMEHVFDSIDTSDIGAVVDAVVEQANRFTGINEQFLTPIEVTAKSVAGTTKTVYADMQKYAESAANSIQNSFATFLEDPSISSFKKMGDAWLQTLDKMAADAAASAIFKAIFQGDNTPTSGLTGLLGGILGGLFGGGAGGSLPLLTSGGITSATQDGFLNAGITGAFANGGSFNVGGSGAVDSQLVAFKATPGENVQVGQNGGGAIDARMYVSVTSPQVTKNDVYAAVQQAQSGAIAKIQDMKRRGKL